MDRAGDVALVPLGLLADVDHERRIAGVAPGREVRDLNLGHLLAGVREEILVAARHVVSSESG